jgi:hypothetical protein
VLFPKPAVPVYLYLPKLTTLVSLYSTLSNKINVPITSFTLSHSNNLFLPRDSHVPIQDLRSDNTNSITLRYISTKEDSFHKLLPGAERNRKGTFWREALHSSDAPPFPPLPPNPLKVNVSYGPNARLTQDCYEWTSVSTLKAILSGIPDIRSSYTEEQKLELICDGRFLHDDENIFGLKKNEEGSVDIILVAYP